MKKIVVLAFAFLFIYVSKAQTTNDKTTAVAAKDDIKNVTPIKNQGITGTCWCFSTTSLIESQCLKNGLGNFDLSEMFSVRNTYLEKAKDYILRQGHTQFGEGGLGHDLINAMSKYGAMPETVYSGLLEGQKEHNHVKLVDTLKKFLDSILAKKPIVPDWMVGYENILNASLGTPPAKFMYNGKEYTPKTFATTVLKFNANDYVYLTSFTHHPYYENFVLEVPDNFSNASYYNVPLNDLLDATKDVLKNNYTVLWDADVSNDGFQQRFGTAVNFNKADMSKITKGGMLNGEVKEGKWDAAERQRLFENLTTQDDHLMHIVALQKNAEGFSYFLVKNSWGNVGPYKGFINVTDGYFAINTVSIVLPKAGLSKEMLAKLKMK